jgi:non-heme chloroperoxidase
MHAAGGTGSATGAGHAAASSLQELLRDPVIPHDTRCVTTPDGARLHTRLYGPADAPVIVLVHGWTARISGWNPQVNLLSASHRIVVYDQRGHGHSSSGTARFTPKLLGADLAAVLAATLGDGTRAMLIGHSMGGISVMAWAARYPEQIARYASSVLLANTAATRLAADSRLLPFPGRFAAVRRPILRAMTEMPLAIPRSRAMRRSVRRTVLSPNASEATVTFVHTIMSSCPGRVRAQWGAALSGLDVRAGVTNLCVPTTVVVGECDRLMPPRVGRRIADELERTGHLYRYVVVPGAGHCANLEDVDGFNAEITRLAEYSRTT